MPSIRCRASVAPKSNLFSQVRHMKSTASEPDLTRKTWVCRFFFPFGLQESNFSEFLGTVYRSEVTYDGEIRQSGTLVVFR